jgi:hypothetical protein
MPTRAFTTLEEVRAEKLRLRMDRDRIQDDLRTHFELVRDPQFRRAMAGDAFGDMIQAWRPLRTLKSMFGRSPSMATGALGMLLGAKAKTPVGRVVISIVGTLLPLIVERFSGKNGAGAGHVGQELATTWERIKSYVRDRRTHHSDPNA